MDKYTFEHLFRDYKDQIWSYILRLVHNDSEQAADLFQQIFIKAYSHEKELRKEKNIRSWIFTVATHTIYDSWKRTRKERELFAQIPDAELAETNDPSQSYYLSEGWTVLDLERALACLPNQHRAILLLFYQNDLTYEEIGSALSLPAGTVKTRIHRARAALKKELERS